MRTRTSQTQFLAMLLMAWCAVALAGPTSKPPLARKLTGEECARMEVELPAVAKAMGWKTSRHDALIEAIKRNKFPDAAYTMFIWLNKWQTESLIRFPYELAGDFGKDCRSGRVRLFVLDE